MGKGKSRFPVAIIFFLLIVSILAFYAPRFLLYASDYRKADAVVLFLGPDFTARKKEAYRIINEGKADYLIIPAYHAIYRIYGEGDIKYISSNILSFSSKKMQDCLSFPSFYEDTHIEAIEAKRIMGDFGIKSAIFVSSPYHMRRIKCIVKKVFAAEQGDFYFVPTSYEKAYGKFWELTVSAWKNVGREYIKILWFSVYSLWGSQ